LASSNTVNQRIEYELEYLKNHYGFPGVTVAYVLPDGSVGEIASGFADMETREPMTPQSRMLAASIGKTFVAATVLALVKEGHLHLDDPLSCWLSDRSWYSRLPNSEAITLRHLLTHSSGIPDHVYTKTFLGSFPQRGMNHDSSFFPESLVACILDQAPLFEAGHGWAYTDTGYILLGLVIEGMTGNSWYEEINRRFLKPLHLEMTSPSDRPTLPGLVAGYTSKDNIFSLPEKSIDESGTMVWNPIIEWTGGGLISTSRGLAVWAKLLYEGHAMQSDYLTDLFYSVPTGDEESGARYGAGVSIQQMGDLGLVWGHGGVIPGYISSMRYYPKYGISVAFQINTDSIVHNKIDSVGDIEHRLAEIVIRSLAIE